MTDAGYPRRGWTQGTAIVLIALPLAVSLLLACGPRERGPRDLRLISESYSFIISPSESPPYAREATLYKVVVRDRDSRQPIETGEGQIFANDSTGASTWDGFVKGAELGTYYGKLNFTIAGLWAVAIRFRRDSLHRLERVEWMQDVYNERHAPVP
jgi:hypothetical protein